MSCLKEMIYLTKLTQDRLYDFQKTKFIKNGKIGIINSFPLFIYEYFKESIWEA